MEINIDKQLKEFRLKVENNSKVILSARFGDGKTYFLDKFKEKYEGEIEFLTLYPVNYSVGKNEDIFEYIKHDLLVQLMQYVSDDDYKIDFDAFTKAVFCKDTLKSLIHFLLEMFPGSDITKKLADKFLDAKDAYNKEVHSASKYVSSFMDKKGIYEMDAYSALICDIIKNIHKQHKVLIIEDLDRLDPAHLFRILNVLAAHIDNPQYKEDTCPNKFGFDKVVIVMDYDVTMHIFQHFYGNEANYEGYMQKFSNGLPYRYSIKEIARKELMEFVKSHIDISEHDFFLIGDKNKSQLDLHSSIRYCWNNLSIRRICSIIESQYKWYDETQKDVFGNVYFLISILHQINFLNGDVKNICDALKNDWTAGFNSICSCFLPFYNAGISGQPTMVFELSENPQSAICDRGKITFRNYNRESGQNVFRYNRNEIVRAFNDRIINQIIEKIVD